MSDPALRLLADIGGTNARFALQRGGADGFADIEVLARGDYPAIGNVALTLGATGGMYVGGGIVPRLGPLFTGSRFRERFEGKGRLSGYLARIPNWLIREEYPALRGVVALPDQAPQG